MTQLDREARVTIPVLVTRGTSNAAVARLLGVSEGGVRYHLGRMAAGALDGRGAKPFKATRVAGAIEYWQETEKGRAINLAALHAWLVAEHGYDGSLRSVQRFWAKHSVSYTTVRKMLTGGSARDSNFHDAGRVISIAPKLDRREQARQAAFEWMRAVLQKKISLDALRREIGDVPDITALLDRLYDGRLSDRNRSMVVLASCRGLSGGLVCDFLGIDKKTHRKYLLTFKNGGHAALFARQTKSTRKFDNEVVKQAVFGILHEPPSNYGINRTTWIMPDLSRVLRETGQPAGPEVIRKITKAAGYRWRKARKVLTSTDPQYREKVHHIQSILAELQENEAFFSIDEFGPFSICAQGGRALVGPGDIPTVPQRQKSKGSLIMTAALELSQNQITYFYSPRKDTGEMLRILSRIIQEYQQKSRIYLSWDAASWHMSKMLYAHVAEHNNGVTKGNVAGPLVELAPLPVGAQFLNVIESVFSGMARAIIANSNYGSVEEARAAIDRYVRERNEKFKCAPKRAGGKIWGREREPAWFSGSNNCKDPRYR